jgi:protein phosphatase
MSIDILNILLKNVRLADEKLYEGYLEDYMNYLENLNGYFNVDGGLINIGEHKYGYVFGDIHGDILTLVTLLQMINFRQVIEKDDILIFLGDYIDRGRYQVETILFLILLQLQYKRNIILLRGNHEPPEWLLPYPHDFPVYLRSRFPDKWRDLYRDFLGIFDRMPHAAVSKNGVFFVHGGISIKASTLDDYKSPDREILTEILWSDPYDEDGYRPSYRGAGYLFGKDITSKFLSKNGLKLIVRGHEPCNGYVWRHNKKVLTIFSRLGEPYYNNVAAVAKIPLSPTLELSDVEFVTLSSDELPKV